MKNLTKYQDVLDMAKQLDMNEQELIAEAEKLEQEPKIIECIDGLKKRKYDPDGFEGAILVLIGLKAFAKNFPVISEETKVCYGAYNPLDGMSSTGTVSKDLILTFTSDGPYAPGIVVDECDIKDKVALLKRVLKEYEAPAFCNRDFIGFLNQMINKALVK